MKALKEFAAEVVERCMRRGATAAEAVVRAETEFSVSVRLGEIETLAEAESMRDDGDKAGARELEEAAHDEMDAIQSELEDELGVDGGAG